MLVAMPRYIIAHRLNRDTRLDYTILNAIPGNRARNRTHTYQVCTSLAKLRLWNTKIMYEEIFLHSATVLH